MRTLLLLGMLIACLLNPACRTIRSTTYIDPQKSFVLGDNQHGNYTAHLKNAGSDQIEIIQIDPEGISSSVGKLEPNQQETFKVAKNQTIRLKNASQQEGVVKIKVIGDTGLNMGYIQN